MSFYSDTDADTAPMRTVLADRDPLARRMLRDALQSAGMTVVAEATTGTEAIELTAFYHPDVVVIDENTTDPDGIEATRVIHDRAPDVCVVVLAADAEDRDGLRALRAGATGYLSRSVEPEMLPRVLRAAIEGEAAISRRLTMALVESYRRVPRAGTGLRPVRSALTDREWEVLDLLAAGAATEEIARTLVLSTETVRSHLKNLYRKLGVRSRAEAKEAAGRMRDLVG